MSEAEPIVVEVQLRKHYRFMYENFIIATQGAAYLLLEKNGPNVSALKFDSTNLRYGSPNDEARGGHPLSAHGLGFYGLYEVQNSPWIAELMRANRVHPMHRDSMYSDLKHYIACFKDVMLEVVCDEMQEVQLSVDEINALVEKQLDYLA
jgi:hypothetical protein